MILPFVRVINLFSSPVGPLQGWYPPRTWPRSSHQRPGIRGQAQQRISRHKERERENLIHVHIHFKIK